MKAYQQSRGIDHNQSITIEVKANASLYLLCPLTDDDLLGALRQIDPSIVKAVWLGTIHADELGLYRVGYLSDSGGCKASPLERFQWHENKAWVVPAEDQE